MTGRPLLKEWTPIRVRLVETNDNGKPLKGSDSPSYTPGQIVLSRTARSVMEPHIKEIGEILPLDCETADYFLLNVTPPIDALDVANSRLKRYSSGEIMHISDYSFIANRLVNQLFFKLSCFAYSPVYMTDTAVNIWKKSGLRGLDFKQIWAGS
jgi:hypothetical protein